MPGPIIYVAVAISAVAAVIVFKEFVYDPHFRPKISAWRDDIASRRRRKAKPHLRSVSSSSSSNSDDDGKQSAPRRGSQNNRVIINQSIESTSHIELRHLITSEVKPLPNTVEAEGDSTGIHLRRVGESSKLRSSVKNENSGRNLGSKSTSQPLIPLDGCEASDGNKGTPILGKAFESHIQSSPLPPPTGTQPQSYIQQVIQQDNASESGKTPFSPSTRGSINLQTPNHIETPSVSVMLPILSPGNVPTPTPMTLGDRGNTRSSSPGTDFSSDMDMLSPDQYLTPRDQTLPVPNDITSPTLSSNLSIELISSPSLSPPGSPFFDAGTYLHELHNPVAQRNEASNGVNLSPGQDERALSGTNVSPELPRDPDVFSVPSQISSDISSDEGDYDSILGSEMSNWTSDVADGEGATQHV